MTLEDLEYDNLIGRPFVLGQTDCFQLSRDFFKQNFDINIRNISRPTNWDPDQLDLIKTLYQNEGFRMVDDWDDLRPADVLATAIGTSNPNHLVIYVGNHLILQHKMNAFSSVETFRPAWKMVTNFIMRHKDVPDLTPVYPDVNIEEILRARNSLPQ